MFMRITLMVWLSASYLCIPSQSQELSPKERDQLIGRMIALSDRNRSLLSAGTATYQSTLIDHIAGTEVTGELTFYLSSDGRIRLQERNGKSNRQHLLIPEGYYRFDGNLIERVRAGNPPSLEKVFMLSPKYFITPLHLQDQGLLETQAAVLNRAVATSLGDVLRQIAVAVTGKKATDFSIARLKERGHYEIHIPNQVVFTVAEEYAFATIRNVVYSKHRPMPGHEVIRRYRKLPNGAFIAEYGEKRSRGWHRNESNREAGPQTPAGRGADPLGLDRTFRFRLINVDLNPPADERFTLEDMGLPSGVILHDQVRQKEYVFGVMPISEENFQRPPVYGPESTATRQYLVIMVGIVLAIFGAVAWWWRFRGMNTTR